MGAISGGLKAGRLSNFALAVAKIPHLLPLLRLPLQVRDLAPLRSLFSNPKPETRNLKLHAKPALFGIPPTVC